MGSTGIRLELELLVATLVATDVAALVATDVATLLVVAMLLELGVG